MKYRAIRILAIGLLSLKALGADPDSRLPVPTPAAQVAEERSIKDIYKDDYAKHDAAGRLALAQKLLQEANAGGIDPTGRFVLLKQSQELAAAAGDVTMSLRAVDALTATYALDSLQTRLAALSRLAHSAKASKENVDVADAALKLADDAGAADQSNVASQAAIIAASSAEKGHDQTRLTNARQALSAIERKHQDSSKANAALKQLEHAPDDPAANLAVGRYICFVRGDWDKGLPYLTHASDTALQSLAKRDLAAPTSGTEMMALADAWWDWAAKAGADAGSGKARAAFWYQRVMPDLTGLRKTLAQQRIDDASAGAGIAAGGDPGAPDLASHKSSALTGYPFARGPARIVKAVFGVDDRVIDVTEAMNKMIKGDAFAVFEPDQSLGDPANGTEKTLKVKLSFQGVTTDLEVHEGDALPLPPLPKDGVPLRGARKGFEVVAARWGFGVEWHDVTPLIREKVTDPTQGPAFEYPGGDIANGIHKNLVIWFNHDGRRYCRVWRDDQMGAPLIDSVR